MRLSHSRMPANNHSRQFSTTLWSVVLLARDEGNDQAADALNTLCRIYWFPIYGYCRLRGMPCAEAEDATQGFFAQFLARGSIGKVDPRKGRFRSFLLVCLKNHLADQHDKATSQRRGGTAAVIPLDTVAAERAIERAAQTTESPDLAYDRHWARALVDRVLAAVRAEFAAGDRGRLFAMLNAEETAAMGQPFKQAEIAGLLDLTEDVVKYQAKVMKQRFQAVLRAEISQTVDSPAEIDGELRYILSLLQ